MNELYEQVETLQNMLVSHATGGSESESEYTRLRQLLLSYSDIEEQLPRFVRTFRNLQQFWQFIKGKYAHYAERRQFLWEAFNPVLTYLEKGPTPSDVSVTTAIETFDATHIQSVWSKALDRRIGDPEGAITMARTLLESVCKHILDEFEVQYGDNDDLPRLYRSASEELNIAPSQHTEAVFKQILGGCTAVVEGLGALRNRISDAHGQGRQGSKPEPRHAELAVNLSGAMAAFLLETYEKRSHVAP